MDLGQKELELVEGWAVVLVKLVAMGTKVKNREVELPSNLGLRAVKCHSNDASQSLALPQELGVKPKK
jgi:hypothetical protein